MKIKKINLLIIALSMISVALFTHNAAAQKKPRLGKVCGDPTAACKDREFFQANDLPFDTGKNFVIAESVWFYAIVLKSAKPDPTAECEKILPESDRLSVQALFPKNVVFAFRCNEAGQNYYNGVKQDVPFLGVYAGATLAEANKFLKTVLATNKYPGVKVRRMQAGINGT